MRRLLVAVSLVTLAFPLFAQPSPRGRGSRTPARFEGLEIAIRIAGEQLANEKTMIERDAAVLRHLRLAGAALADSMQPANALQKAYEEVDAAKGLGPDFTVMQGVTTLHRALEEARRSPGAADFDRLRALLRTEAIAPASRVVVRNALRLQEETTAWLRTQTMLADHLRALSELSSESLRAAEEP